MPLAELSQVYKEYGTGEVQVTALADVSLSIESGEFTVFSGPSGSGKTTLLNLIGCLDQATRGNVLLEGKDTRTLSSQGLAELRAARIGFIFQAFNLIPVLSALENVEMAMELSGRPFPDRRDRALKVLDEVGLKGLADRRPNQLSGGQQQRVAIARALVKEPALVIADEPTANLDSHTGQQVLDLMRDMNQRSGVTFLFSTHDPRVMACARRVLVLRDGRLEGDERREVAS